MALKVANINCKYLYIATVHRLLCPSFNSVQTGSYINASSQLWTGIMVWMSFLHVSIFWECCIFFVIQRYIRIGVSRR